jgi:hypothetical protein
MAPGSLDKFGEAVRVPRNASAPDTNGKCSEVAVFPLTHKRRFAYVLSPRKQVLIPSLVNSAIMIYKRVGKALYF